VSLREDAACDADRPSDIPDRGWFDVLARLARSLGRNGMWLRSAWPSAPSSPPFRAAVTVALFGLPAGLEAVH